MTIFIEDRRRRIVNWLGKLQHFFAGVPLFVVALQRIMSGDDARAAPFFELAIAGGVLATFIHETLAERNYLTGKRAAGEHAERHPSFGWFDLAAAVLLMFEAFHGHHHKPGYLRPQFLSGLTALGFGLFHYRIQTFVRNRQYIKLDDVCMEIRMSRFRRMSVPWTELSSIALSDTKLVVHRKDGGSRTFGLKWITNAEAVRNAVGEYPAVAALMTPR